MSKQKILLLGAATALVAVAFLVWKMRPTPQAAQDFAAIPVQGLPALVYNPRKSVAAQAPEGAPVYQEAN